MKLRVSFILFFRVIFTEKSISDIVLKSQGHLQGKTKVREGHGTMVRAWRFSNVAVSRAVSNPAWCRIFREISCLSPLNLGTLFRWCVLGQGTLTSNASLDSGGNEYLVGQRWQCVQ